MNTFPQPNPKTQTLARTFSYTTFALFLGAMIYLLTNNLINLTFRPDWVGSLALGGFALIYGNVSFFVARRYMRKKYTYKKYPFIVAVILLIPAIVLIRIKQTVFFDIASEIIFILIILVGVLVGAYYGIKKGEIMYEEEQQRKRQKEHI